MKKPFKFTIICNKTGRVNETNIEPLLSNLQNYEPTNNPNISELKQTKTCFIDTRYTAKIRLYNYVEFTRKGLSKPTYEPFKNSEIGKSIPILNF